jgi:hypothetical protein
VPLAELDAGQSAGTDGSCRRREPVLSHRLDEQLGAAHDVVTSGGEAGRIPALGSPDPLAREVGDRLGPAVGGDIPQGLHGELVVVGWQGAVAALGDDVGTSRPTATADLRGTGVVLLDGAVVGERVEVPADRGGRQPEQLADRSGGDGAVLGHRGEHAFPRALLVGPDKHHTIVT